MDVPKHLVRHRDAQTFQARPSTCGWSAWWFSPARGPSRRSTTGDGCWNWRDTEWRSERETQPLSARYGPGRYSEHFEEWIVRDYYQDRQGGVFLDVGAHHYRTASNTYYLESSLGWSRMPSTRSRSSRPTTSGIAPGPSSSLPSYPMRQATWRRSSFRMHNKLVASASEELPGSTAHRGRRVRCRPQL